MKRWLCIILAVLMTALCGCGNTSTETAQPTETQEESTINSIYAEVTPLDSEVSLTFAQILDSHTGFVNSVIEQLGGFQQANIDVSAIAYFANNAAYVEAVDSWDLGLMDAMGVAMGVPKNILCVGSAARDVGEYGFWAHEKNIIYKAGVNNIEGTSNFYGTPEEWAQRSISYTAYSPLSYVLDTAIAKLGIDMKKSTFTNTTNAKAKSATINSNAAIAGIYGSLAYSMPDTHHKIVGADSFGFDLTSSFVASPRCYSDSTKEKAISKWLELYFITVDWIYDNKDNFTQACKIWAETNETHNIETTEYECMAMLADDSNRHFTLSESLDMFDSNATAGGASVKKIIESNYGIFEYCVQKGYVESAKKDNFLSSTFVDQYLREAAALYTSAISTYVTDTLPLAEWAKEPESIDSGTSEPTDTSDSARNIFKTPF